jgi:hypothetical protein
MQAINVTTAPTKLADAGNRKFVHIMNTSDVTIYVQYDGSSTTLTTSNGLPIAPGEKFGLENDGTSPIFDKEVWAIHGGSGNKEVRLQGV